MDQYKKNSLRQRYKSLAAALLPISFIGTGFLNAITFPFGLHAYDTVRMLVNNGIIALVALILVVEVGMIWREKRETRKTILYTACIPALFGILYLIALCTRTNITMRILKYGVIYGCYLVSLCCAWLVIALEDRLRQFLRICRIYAVILAPIMLYYCIRFYIVKDDPYISNLGSIDYMTLGYMLLEMCIFLAVDRLLFAHSDRRVRWLDWGLFLLFSVSIALGQCKGPMICLAFLAVLLIAAAAWQKIGCRTAVQLCLTACLSLALFSTILFPSNGNENRFLEFLKELSPENKVTLSIDQLKDVTQAIGNDLQASKGNTTSTETEEPTEPTEPETPTEQPTEPEKPAEPAGPEQSTVPTENIDIVDYFYSGKAEQALLAGTITQEQYDEMEETAYLLNSTNVGGRISLWLYAVDEIKSDPLLGQGIMFYENKYGTDPHNFYLNLATDFGLIVAIAVIVLGIVTFIKMIGIAKTNKKVLAYSLYVFAYLPATMVGRSAYSYIPFFQYGMCLVLVWCICRTTKRSEQKKNDL